MSQGGHPCQTNGCAKEMGDNVSRHGRKAPREGNFRTKSNAQARLSGVLNEIDKGTYTLPSSLSFEQFAREWLLGRRQIRGSTEAGYSSLIDKQRGSRSQTSGLRSRTDAIPPAINRRYFSRISRVSTAADESYRSGHTQPEGLHYFQNAGEAGAPILGRFIALHLLRLDPKTAR
jgi:hypothetical protein